MLPFHLLPFNPRVAGVRLQLLQTQDDLQAKLSSAATSTATQSTDDSDALRDEIRSLKSKLENGAAEAVEGSATSLKRKPSWASSNGSRLSLGGKDEDAVMRDQIRGFQVSQ